MAVRFSHTQLVIFKTLYPMTKNLDLSKFKALADDNSKVTKMAKLVFNCLCVDNIVDKGENACNKRFPFFSPLCFQKPTSFRVVKSRDCSVKD